VVTLYVCIPIGESEMPDDVVMFTSAATRLASELAS
jgi:hypothetical protein